jgi:hypothetical protein
MDRHFSFYHGGVVPMHDCGGSENIILSLDGVKAVNRKALPRDLQEVVKLNSLPASSKVSCVPEAGSSPDNLQRCTKKDESLAMTSLTIARKVPWQYGSVESTCKTVSEVLACWSAAAAFSQDILMFLLLVKTYGLTDAILYSVKAGLNLTAEIEASIAEFCKREKVDFGE